MMYIINNIYIYYIIMFSVADTHHFTHTWYIVLHGNLSDGKRNNNK